MTQAKKLMVAAGCVAAALVAGPATAQVAPIPIPPTPSAIVVTAEISPYVTLSVGSATITFVAPGTPGQSGYMVPSTGLDGNFGQSGPTDVVSAVAADRLGPGVASMRATTNRELCVTMDPGSPLTVAGGTATLPTSFCMQPVGRFKWIGDSSYRAYAGLETVSGPWVAAAASPVVGYMDRGQVADMYLRAKIVRNGVADVPGFYSQPSKLTITVTEK